MSTFIESDDGSEGNVSPAESVNNYCSGYLMCILNPENSHSHVLFNQVAPLVLSLIVVETFTPILSGLVITPPAISLNLKIAFIY